MDKPMYFKCTSYCIKPCLIFGLGNNTFWGNLGWFSALSTGHTLSRLSWLKCALFSTLTLNRLTQNWLFNILIFPEWCTQQVITSGRKPMSSFQFFLIFPRLLRMMSCGHIWPMNTVDGGWNSSLLFPLHLFSFSTTLFFLCVWFIFLEQFFFLKILGSYKSLLFNS